MKRGLFLLAMLAWASPAFAQFTTVTATVQDSNGIPYSGAVLNAVLVPSTGGGYTLSGQPYSGRIGPVTLDSSGSFTVNFGDVTLITPGSPQWQITIDSAAATISLPLGTGPQQFTYTSTGTTISGSSPVSLTSALNALAPKLTNFANSGLAPNVPGIPSYNGPNIVYAANYGVQATAKMNCLGIVTNASNQVTMISGSNGPGTPFSAADQGSSFFATNGQCAGNYGEPTPSSVLISGFICANGGFVNATTVNICTTAAGSTPANATGTCTSTTGGASCPVSWAAVDDTAALQTAFNRIFAPSTSGCGALILPQGRMKLTKPINESAAGSAQCTHIGPNQTTVAGFSVLGQGQGSSILAPWNTFDANAAPGCGNPFLDCFFGVPVSSAPTGITLMNFSVDGGGNGAVTNGTNKNIFYMPGPGTYENIMVTEWGQNTTGFTAFAFGGNVTDLAPASNLSAWSGGQNCFSSAGETTLVGMSCFDLIAGTINAGGSGCTTTIGGDFTGGASTAQGGAFQVKGPSAAIGSCWNDFGSHLRSSGSGPVIECGSTCRLNGTFPAGNGGASQIALYMQDTAGNPGTAYVSDSTIENPAQVAIGGGVAGSVIYDLCGNTLVGSITQTNISIAACPTSPAISNVPSLTGTGPCATITTQLPASTGAWTGSFKCTGTTGTATITITFGYTAPNGWNLTNAWDQTTVANTLHQNAGGSTTTLIMGSATVTQNDVISWSATPY